MKKVVIIGSLNIDIVAQVNRIPSPGETISCDAADEFFGGKGANQAFAVAKAGVDVAIVGKVGNDENGHKVVENLKSVGVDTRYIFKSDDYHTGFAFISVDEHAENAIVVVKGANQHLTTQDIDHAMHIIEESDIVLIQQEIPKETIEYVITNAHQLGKMIILNPAPVKEISSEVISKVDLLTPNRTELGALLNKNIGHSEDEIISVLDQINHDTYNDIIVTLGSEGVIYCSKGDYRKYKSYKVTPVDTTGAGDCFNGYLAASIAKGLDVSEAIDQAQKAAAISITKLGAQSSTPSSAEISNIQIKKL